MLLLHFTSSNRLHRLNSHTSIHFWKRQTQIFTSWGGEENSLNRQKWHFFFACKQISLKSFHPLILLALIHRAPRVSGMRHLLLRWLHFSHLDYLWADSCMTYDPHPKKESRVKATMNFIHSPATVILWSIDNTLSWRAE